MCSSRVGLIVLDHCPTAARVLTQGDRALLNMAHRLEAQGHVISRRPRPWHWIEPCTTTVAEAAQEFELELKQLRLQGLDQVFGVAQGLGAVMALSMVQALQSQVQGLVLINPTGTGAPYVYTDLLPDYSRLVANSLDLARRAADPGEAREFRVYSPWTGAGLIQASPRAFVTYWGGACDATQVFDQFDQAVPCLIIVPGDADPWDQDEAVYRRFVLPPNLGHRLIRVATSQDLAPETTWAWILAQVDT